MNKLKTFIYALILAIAINAVVVPVQTNAGVASFKTALISAITANFTAPQRVTISDSFVSAYQSEWDARVASGTVDNAANRGSFAADKLIDYVQGIVTSEKYKSDVRAIPSPSPLPQ